MSSTIAWSRPGSRGTVLVDLMSRSWISEVALAAGGVLALAASAQVAIPLSFTPVPITGQTFAVMVIGSSYGLVRALIAMVSYLLVGLAGAPVFSPDPKSGHPRTGQQLLQSPSLGYVIGMLVAIALLGLLSQRAWDRRFATATAQMALANIIIYVFGVTWLARAAHLDTQTALAKGLLPFLLGDSLKIALAASVLPVAWRVVNRFRS
jgi:biotin transport system substrate-specific component